MEHPAHRIAGMAADVAEELRGYLAPTVDLPWELSEDDHRDLMPRLCDAVARLADCIGSIAQATTDEDAKGHFIEGARTILRGCAHVQAAGTVLPGGQRSPGPGAATRPQQLTASDFPQPMTRHLLRPPALACLQPPWQRPGLPARQHRRCRAARLPRLPTPPATPGADTAGGSRSEVFPHTCISIKYKSMKIKFQL